MKPILNFRAGFHFQFQFLYGEDGLDVSKSQFLKEKLLTFLTENSDCVLDPQTLEQLKRLGDTKALKKHKAKVS